MDITVRVSNTSEYVAIKIVFLVDGEEKTALTLGPVSRQRVAREDFSVTENTRMTVKDFDSGHFITDFTVSRESPNYNNEAKRFEIVIDPPTDQVKDLKGNGYQLVPHDVPVLSTYDPRRMFADNLTEGRRTCIFKQLYPESRNFYTDGSYIVMNGLSFTRVNTALETTESRVVTTVHDTAEAWNIGIKVSAGKAPAGGSLSANYSESSSELRSGTAGYVYARKRTEHYKLTMNPEQSSLTDEFIEDVYNLLQSAAESDTLVNLAREISEKNAEIAEQKEKLIKAQLEMDYARYEAPEVAGEYQRDISRYESLIRSFRRTVSAWQNRLEKAVDDVNVNGVAKFIRLYGTHYARHVVFGRAEYETTRISMESLKRMYEKGVNVGLEAQGQIKGVDVGVEIEGGYSRKVSYSSEISSANIKRVTIGGEGFDQGQPIEVELSPISKLFIPSLFPSNFDAATLSRCSETLESVTNALLDKPDIYPVLAGLEIWMVIFNRFTTKQVSHTRQVYGSIWLKRSSATLQARDSYLDADLIVGNEGYYIWSRGAKSGSAVFMHPNGEGIAEYGRKPVYLITDGSIEDPKLRVNWDLRDMDDQKWRANNRQTDVTIPSLRAGTSEVRVGDVIVYFEAKRIRFDDLPPFKRLEIAASLEQSLS